MKKHYMKEHRMQEQHRRNQLAREQHRKAIPWITAAVLSLLLPVTAIAAEQDSTARDRSDREAGHERQHRHRHSHDKTAWSYLELSSLEYDMDIFGVDVEPDGYKLELSLALGDSLFGILDRSGTEGNFAGRRYDFDTEGYGFGFHGDSWFASYTYNTWDFDNNEFDVDTLRVGFRDTWTDRLEFNASYSWNNIEGADNDDGFLLGFAYELWDSLSLTADYESIGGHFDVDSYALGIRLDF